MRVKSGQDSHIVIKTPEAIRQSFKALSQLRRSLDNKSLDSLEKQTLDLTTKAAHVVTERSIED